MKRLLFSCIALCFAAGQENESAGAGYTGPQTPTQQSKDETFAKYEATHSQGGEADQMRGNNGPNVAEGQQPLNTDASDAEAKPDAQDGE